MISQEWAVAQAPGVRLRRNLRSYAPAEIEKLRKAFRTLYATNGDLGYQTIAGYHGEPGNYCHQDSTIFLPWHRAYILRIEDALRQIDSSITLPFWDWTDAPSIQSGIPAIYADQDAVIDGQNGPNPLVAANIAVANGRLTTRNPLEPFRLESIAQAVKGCFSETTYSNFNSRLSGPHGSLHTWVRGDMGSTTYAAYDPIFWAHHCNVDRQWAQWQVGPNNAAPDLPIMQKNLNPFGKKVSDVIDFRGALKYDYEGLRPMAPTHVHLLTQGEVMRVDDLDLSTVPTGPFLRIHDLRASAESYNVDVFIDQPEATLKDATKENIHFAGSFGIFGGSKHAEHSDEVQTMIALDLSPALTKLRKQNGKQTFSVKLIVTDLSGKVVDLKKLPAKGTSVGP